MRAGPMRLALLAVLALALAPLQSAVAAPKVTVVFTGDNGGEVAPCG